MTRRAIAWMVLAVVGVGCLAIAAFDDGGPTSAAERVQALSQVFACPECDGQSVAESNAAVASNIRDFIRLQVADDATDEEIRDRLIEAYGSDVLLTPPASGVSVLVWVLPVLVVVLGLGVLVAIVLRSRATPSASDDDRCLVAGARSAAAVSSVADEP